MTNAPVTVQTDRIVSTPTDRAADRPADTDGHDREARFRDALARHKDRQAADRARHAQPDAGQRPAAEPEHDNVTPGEAAFGPPTAAPAGIDGDGGSGAAASLGPEDAAGRAGGAGAADAFADLVARTMAETAGDGHQLRLAFEQAGWPLTGLTVTQTPDGRLSIQLATAAHDTARLERRLATLHDRLVQRGLKVDHITIATDGQDADRIIAGTARE